MVFTKGNKIKIYGIRIQETKHGNGDWKWMAFNNEKHAMDYLEIASHLDELIQILLDKYHPNCEFELKYISNAKSYVFIVCDK